MNVTGAVALFGYKTAFQTIGSARAARALVHALASPDENVRTMAGMFLVQIGDRAIPFLRAGLEGGQNVPVILAILADIGDPHTRPDIESFLGSPDPIISSSARDALETLDLNRIKRR